jgi:hypothetical protein
MILGTSNLTISSIFSNTSFVAPFACSNLYSLADAYGGITLPNWASPISLKSFLGASSIIYPPIALTGVSTSITDRSYGNGTYTVTTPNTDGVGQNAFDKTSTQWVTSSSFTNSVWQGTSTTINSVVYKGPILQLQLPVSSRIASVSIASTNTITSPRLFYIFASNDGIGWILLYTYSDNGRFNTNLKQTIVISQSIPYTYYRYIPTEIYTLTGMYLYRLNEITYNSKTTEFYNYPPIALTGPSTTLSNAAGNGTYVVTSSEGTGWNAFEKTSTQWVTTSAFNAHVWTGPSTTINSIVYNGPVLTIQLPTAIKLGYITISAASAAIGICPTIFYIFGSNNGTSWTLLYTYINDGRFSVTNGLSQTFLIDSNITYSYFMYIPTSVVSSAIGLYRLTECVLHGAIV